MNNQDTDEMESTVRITKSKIQEKVDREQSKGF